MNPEMPRSRIPNPALEERLREAERSRENAMSDQRIEMPTNKLRGHIRNLEQRARDANPQRRDQLLRRAERARKELERTEGGRPQHEYVPEIEEVYDVATILTGLDDMIEEPSANGTSPIVDYSAGNFEPENIDLIAARHARIYSENAGTNPDEVISYISESRDRVIDFMDRNSGDIVAVSTALEAYKNMIDNGSDLEEELDNSLNILKGLLSDDEIEAIKDGLLGEDYQIAREFQKAYETATAERAGHKELKEPHLYGTSEATSDRQDEGVIEELIGEEFKNPDEVYDPETIVAITDLRDVPEVEQQFGFPYRRTVGTGVESGDRPIYEESGGVPLDSAKGPAEKFSGGQ